MGLKITTISQLPEDTGRRIFIYFLDYGWDEPLTNAMYENFDRLSVVAANHGSLVMAGLCRQEFANEVLNWHHVNGLPADNLLPAIMITDCEPALLAKSGEFGAHRHHGDGTTSYPERFVILPLREICSTPSDVARLLEKIAQDLKAGSALSDFEVTRLIDKSDGALADMLILKPNLFGVGIDLPKTFEVGRDKLKKKFKRGP
jgi:hypothetical protein